ncbi:hypothetical protein Tco_1451164 [Tanacetum coccineum]
MQLTHLCFANDLLVLCHGDSDYVGVVKKSVDKFSKVSGLHPNMSKSTIFFGSLNESERTRILSIMSFAMEKLPMKYLGVPLLAQRLTVTDCKILVDKAKVAWKLVCRPKDKGGLGIKPLHEWNKGWKNLMNIRDSVKDKMIQVWGNGKGTSMWYDKWHSQGPLCEVISKRARYEAGILENFNVSDMIEDENYKWPINWNKKFPSISNMHVPILQDNVHDKIVWINKNRQHKQYITNMVW